MDIGDDLTKLAVELLDAAHNIWLIKREIEGVMERENEGLNTEKVKKDYGEEMADVIVTGTSVPMPATSRTALRDASQSEVKIEDELQKLKQDEDNRFVTFYDFYKRAKALALDLETAAFDEEEAYLLKQFKQKGSQAPKS